jgi:putative SOS response-associated peptidase YedK
MCGRVRLPDDYSEIKIDPFPDGIAGNFPRRWNVPPTLPVPVLRSKEGVRIFEPMRWCLIPNWAKDNKIEYSTFNARADGVDTKPAFRGAWKAGRRCLIITDGFYEWRKSDKQPFAIAMGNRGLMTIAGLWEAWKPKEAEDWTLSCTIITTDANPLLGEVHDRMPAILGHEDWPKWLGEEKASPDELKSMLKPFDASRMAIWPVDKKVGNVKNEGPELAERIAA